MYEVLNRIVVGWRGNDNEFGILIGGCAIQRGGQIEVFFSKILLDVIALDRRDPIIDFIHLLRHDIHQGYSVMLRNRCRDG